jgi:hypothetical protein
VTLDGSAKGTTRDLTITNGSTSVTSAVVWGQTTTGGDPATHDVVRNCVVMGSDRTLTLFGVGFAGATVALASTGNGNAANRVENCDVRRVQYGIYSSGLSAAAKNTGTVIRGNELGSSGTSSIGTGGILVRFEDGVEIDHNHVANLANSLNGSMFGISLGLTDISSELFTGSEVTNALVHHNTIQGVSNTHPTGTSAGGIITADASTGTTSIYDNMISGVFSFANDPDLMVGILVGGGTGTTRVLFNSVSMMGFRQNAAGPSLCLGIGGNDPPVDVRNNIFSANASSGGPGLSYLIGLNTQLTYNNLTCDYNDYYTQVAYMFIIGGFENSPAGDVNSFASWKATTGTDAHSMTVAPGFVDAASNLHITGASAVNNLGQPIAGITTDIDDEAGLRATKPDLGADEFAAYNLVVNTVGSGQTGISPVLPNYPTGTSVTLTAAPLAHYHFVGWSGTSAATRTRSRSR